MKQKSPMLRLWELGEGQQGGLKRAVLSAVVGVLFGMLPYFAAAQIILGLLKGEESTQYYLIWCAVALVGFLLRATLYSLALSQSHKATFAILKSIREKVLEKLPKMPLGTILDTSSGQMKQIIVDQVESMERPLAHLLPEMTANVLGPVCILIYLFVLDWRMALLSLVSIPVGMAFMMAVMAGYGKQYEGSVKTTQAMNSAIVEYIGGIEVIKAFNQGKQSYARFSDSVKANASYFYHWMKSCQMPVSLARAISPTTMITILPVGWLLYTGGGLPIETFITTIVLSLGIAGPLLAAMDFVDSLAKVGTIVGSVDAILNGVVKPVPQEEMAIVGELRPAPKIFKETCRIDWNQPVKKVYDFIRGLSPYPAAWSELVSPEGEVVVVKIFESEKVSEAHQLSAGTIVTDGKKYIKVAVPDGFVSVLSLQLPGKKRLKTDELLRGFRLTNEYKMN